MKTRLIFLSGILVSCTFPSVTYDDGGVSDATIDTFVVDASNDVVDDVVIDAAPQDDGNDPCDFDQDHYRSTACEGGTDCNDHDNRVNPGVTVPVYAIPDAAPFGDWNCDGVITYDYPPVTCGLNECNVTTFAGTVNCGQTGVLETCTGLITCGAVDSGVVKTQGCL